MAEESFNFGGLAVRFALALVLVFATFNPTGTSFYHWVADTFPQVTAVQVLAGVVLLIGWIVFFGATMRSLGITGVLLSAALCAALVWVAVDFGWLEADSTRTYIWIALVVAAGVLALGMSWSHVRRRMSGQVDVDEVESR